MSKNVNERKHQYKKGFATDGLGVAKRRIMVEKLNKQRRKDDVAQRRKDAHRNAHTHTDMDVDVAGAQASEMMAALRNAGNADEQARALKRVCAALSSEEDKEDVPIDALISLGCVPVLVSLLSSPNQEIQYDAVRAFKLIATGTSEHTETLLAAVPALTTLLNSSNPLIQEEAAWALGNLAGESIKAREALFVPEAVHSMLRDLASENIRVARKAAWALTNAFEGRGVPIGVYIQAGLLPVLLQSFERKDEDLATECLWAIVPICASPHEDIPAAFLQANGLAALLSVLRTYGAAAAYPALQCISLLVQRFEQAMQALTGQEWFLHALNGFTTAEHRGVRHEAVTIISSFSTSSDARVVQLAYPYLHTLANTLKRDHFDIRKDALFGLFNVAQRDAQSLEKVVSLDIIRNVLSMLTGADVEAVGVALRFTELLLRNGYKDAVEEADGISALESLQTREDSELWRAATRLVDEFYGEDEDDFAPAPAPVQEEYPHWRNQSRMPPQNPPPF